MNTHSSPLLPHGAYLLKRQLESQRQTFVESGGFTEKLYGARSQGRRSDGCRRNAQ
jgi:four helix bundle suffix protein